MNKLILIAGNYGVGKTTLAKTLEENLFNSIHLSLGDFVREKLANSLSIPKELLYKKPTPDYIRNLIKGYATYIKEYVDKNYWCLSLYRKFLLSNRDILILGDLRFLHEIDYFKQFFKRIDIIYIGDKSSDYDLGEIYNISNIKVDKYPNLEEVLKYVRYV